MNDLMIVENPLMKIEMMPDDMVFSFMSGMGSSQCRPLIKEGRRILKILEDARTTTSQEIQSYELIPIRNEYQDKSYRDLLFSLESYNKRIEAIKDGLEFLNSILQGRLMFAGDLYGYQLQYREDMRFAERMKYRELYNKRTMANKVFKEFKVSSHEKRKSPARLYKKELRLNLVKIRKELHRKERQVQIFNFKLYGFDELCLAMTGCDLMPCKYIEIKPLKEEFNKLNNAINLCNGRFVKDILNPSLISISMKLTPYLKNLKALDRIRPEFLPVVDFYINFFEHMYEYVDTDDKRSKDEKLKAYTKYLLEITNGKSPSEVLGEPYGNNL